MRVLAALSSWAAGASDNISRVELAQILAQFSELPAQLQWSSNWTRQTYICRSSTECDKRERSLIRATVFVIFGSISKENPLPEETIS